jgi:acetyl esterase/lipase
MEQPTGWPVDPKLFDPEQIPPLTRAFNAQIEMVLASVPSILELPITVVREARARGASALGVIATSPRAVNRLIPTPAGELPLRVITTPGARGVLLHLHPGGWSLGAHDQQDMQLESIAITTGLSIVSVGYRLAPEHPYPAAPDDCEQAALWLIANAAHEFGTGTLFIGGESAGAHLALLTLLRLRDRHGLKPFDAAFLTYGCFDLTLSPSAHRWGRRNLVLSTPIIEQFVNWFAPRQDRRDPDISPLYADLKGLPPALFTVGTLDPLLDDSMFMACRWLAAGNSLEFALYPGAIHGFNLIPNEQALAANARIMAFLLQRLALASAG